MPAALPTLTTSSRVAWKLVAAGAIRVSWVTGCPSELTEIQEFSLARTTSVNLVADCPDGFAALAPKERIVTSPFFSTWTALGSASAAAIAGTAAILGGSVLGVDWTDRVESCVTGAGVATVGAADVDGGAVGVGVAAGAALDACGAGGGAIVDAAETRASLVLREWRVHKNKAVLSRTTATATRIQEFAG